MTHSKHHLTTYDTANVLAMLLKDTQKDTGIFDLSIKWESPQYIYHKHYARYLQKVLTNSRVHANLHVPYSWDKGAGDLTLETGFVPDDNLVIDRKNSHAIFKFLYSLARPPSTDDKLADTAYAYKTLFIPKSAITLLQSVVFKYPKTHIAAVEVDGGYICVFPPRQDSNGTIDIDIDPLFGNTKDVPNTRLEQFQTLSENEHE